MYIIRAAGGGLFLLGALLMAYNLVRTALGHGEAGETAASDAPKTATPVLQPAE